MNNRADPLRGRELESSALSEVLQRDQPGLVTVTGPGGRGKTALLRSVLTAEESIHFQAAPLTDEQLLGDFREFLRRRLGEVPEPRTPGVLPLPSGMGGWLSLFVGLVDRVEETGRPMTLALDGIEGLLARRRMPVELGEALDRARRRGLPFRVVLAGRDQARIEELASPEGPLGSAELSLRLPPLPFRVAGWGHGARNPRDAFLRWALLGDHPAHLPPDPPVGDLEEAVRSRVLSPGGDLFDAPLVRLEATFQRPARYTAILRALAPGPLDWSGLLERAPGIDSGGQLAPYLRRLEEEGMIVVDQPLDAPPDSRRRRYSLADPFFAFWFGWVLPHRSALSAPTAVDEWVSAVLPGPRVHLQGWMEEAARRWLHRHAAEAFGAPAREAGALWGGEAVFPVAGRLANGQVCYGMVEWGAPDAGLPDEMTRRMAATRYGIGREARAPLFFLGEEGGEALRRLVAREPLARVVDLEDLMGPGAAT